MTTTGAREIVDKAGVIVFTVALSPNGKSITERLRIRYVRVATVVWWRH
jgi:hypothetical protein